MNRFIKALARNLSRPKAPVAADQACNAVSAEDVLMPDIYAVTNVDPVPDLETLDLSTPDIDGSAGFNPYDTAILRKKFGPKPR
jgi:magnesium-transporting ATPase (P-type)